MRATVCLCRECHLWIGRFASNRGRLCLDRPRLPDQDTSSGNNYTISFKVPLPAQAFWSLPLYNSTNFLLIQTPINRYNMGDRVSVQTFMLTLMDFPWRLRIQRMLETTVTASSLAYSGTFAQMQVAHYVL